MSAALVVIPTFNERENIGELIDRIFALKLDLHVLVVDDHSPDGTAELVREKQRVHGEELLQLVVRTEGKAGRGSACLHGFKIAREKGYRAAIEMDADLSHNPADIPRFLDALSDADVVVGSKYVPGGRVEGWEWYRHLLSRSANLYARLILQMPIRDYTNGYRCYSAKALALLPELEIDGTGFTVIPQMSYRLHQAGMRFAEIPIVFINRRRGTSNMSIHEITKSFFAILKIRSHTLHLHISQLLKFGSTGMLNLVLDFSLLTFFMEIVRLPIIFAGPAASAIVIINVFFMNKYWTFKNQEKKHVEQGIKFGLVYGSSFILVNAITWGLTEIILLWYIFSRLIAIAICAVWNYLWMHHKVFGGR